MFLEFPKGTFHAEEAKLRGAGRRTPTARSAAFRLQKREHVRCGSNTLFLSQPSAA